MWYTYALHIITPPLTEENWEVRHKQKGGNEAIQIVTSEDDYYLLNAEIITEEALDLLTASMHTVMTFLTVMTSMMKMTTITFQTIMINQLFSSVYMIDVLYNCQLYSVVE